MVPKSRGLIEGKAVKLPVDRKCTLIWSSPGKKGGQRFRSVERLRPVQGTSRSSGPCKTDCRHPWAGEREALYSCSKWKVIERLFGSRVERRKADMTEKMSAWPSQSSLLEFIVVSVIVQASFVAPGIRLTTTPTASSQPTSHPAPSGSAKHKTLSINQKKKNAPLCRRC